MWNIVKKVIQYPRVTQNYPKVPFNSQFYNGSPEMNTTACQNCGECIRRCPSEAISNGDTGVRIDLGRCLFCSLCSEVCPSGAIRISHQFELAEQNRGNLYRPTLVVQESEIRDSEAVLAEELNRKAQKLFGRSLQIREVDAGSCNGCDCEINSVNNPFNDLERFGIHFVASPRHADMLLVTGPAARNMELALKKTYEATPNPKLVVAVGACACSGGIFRQSYAVKEGINTVIPVDVFIPGCPPRPQAIIFGILKALARI